MVDHFEFGALIQSYGVILHANPTIKVQFVKRQANSAAHTLARVASMFACSQFYSFILDCIVSAIFNEMK